MNSVMNFTPGYAKVSNKYAAKINLAAEGPLVPVFKCVKIRPKRIKKPIMAKMLLWLKIKNNPD